MLLMLLLMFVYSDASDCNATDEFTWDNVSYSLFFDCSLNYDDAVNECNNTGMQILRLKTTKETKYLSSVIVKRGYSPAVWVSGICPDIGTASIVDVMCAKFSANTTDKVTRGYVVLASECHDNHGWICEDKTDVHPCPPPTPTSPTTTPPTRTTTPTTSTTTASTPPLTTASTATTTSPTITATTTSSTTPTRLTTPATDTTSHTSTAVPTACGDPQEIRTSLNQYLLFIMCEQTVSAAIDQCSAYNSSLAVLRSEGELQYLAARIGGQRNGSWSFWIGGLMQTGNCVIVSFDQSVVANLTDRKFTISIGHNCHESHMLVCKTVTDLVHANPVLQRRKQGTVMDHRPTAIFLGSVGVAVMVAVVLFVVVIDVPNLVGDLGRAMWIVKGFTAHLTRKAQPKDVAKTTP